MRRIERAASESGARALDVTILVLNAGARRVPAVTLEADNPAAYMKHWLRAFLERIGYFKPDGLAFVELVDTRGKFAWAAGQWQNGGMVGSRPGLDQCSPIAHSEPVGITIPPCPAA